MTEGIAICSCGNTLSDMIKIDNILETCEKSNILCKKFSVLCKNEGLDELKEWVENNKINRILIAACTPKLIELSIKNKLKSKIVDFVCIREHVAWPYQDQPQKEKHLLHKQ